MGVNNSKNFRKKKKEKDKNQLEKLEINDIINNESNKDISEIDIIYNINTKNINIFGYDFVKNNKNICKMIINNKEYEIAEKYNVQSIDEILKIRLKGINKVINMKGMFYGCSSLLSLSNISNLNTKKLKI